MNRALITGFATALSVLPATLSAQTDDNFNMNMSIDADGEQMNMNMSIDADGEQMNMNIRMDGMEMDMDQETWGEPEVPTQATSAPVPTGPMAMDDMDFSRYLNAIKAKDFEDSKLTTAKAPLRGQYLTAEQVGHVMRAFDFESTRLEFATYAHPRCVDPGNYYLTYDAFEFEMSIEELEEAIAE